MSRVKKQKPELDIILLKLPTEDNLVVTRMDQLGRNTIQLLQSVEHLREKEVHFAIFNLGIEVKIRKAALA
ncbi:hypothetical protein CN354_07965 [Bacillus cereus]|nr:hypothetical protein CN354_07965 [Bacillus cereus]